MIHKFTISNYTSGSHPDIENISELTFDEYTRWMEFRDCECCRNKWTLMNKNGYHLHRVSGYGSDGVIMCFLPDDINLDKLHDKETYQHFSDLLSPYLREEKLNELLK